jgi:hypothetical protein
MKPIMEVSTDLNNLKALSDTLTNYHWVRYKVIADHSDYGEACRYAKKSYELGAQQHQELRLLLQDIAAKSTLLAQELTEETQ